MRYFRIVDGDYIVAAGFGDAGEEISYSEFVMIKSLYLEAPFAAGFEFRLNAVTLEWDKFEKDRAELSDEEIREIYSDEIISSIEVQTKPSANKKGYHLVQRYDAGSHAVVWEYVKDDGGDDSVAGGTYINPTEYHVGDVVTKFTDADPFNGDGWYAFEGDVKVCIKSGTPANFDDEEYFAYSAD